MYIDVRWDETARHDTMRHDRTRQGHDKDTTRTRQDTKGQDTMQYDTTWLTWPPEKLASTNTASHSDGSERPRVDAILPIRAAHECMAARITSDVAHDAAQHCDTAVGSTHDMHHTASTATHPCSCTSARPPGTHPAREAHRALL
jgi:hypothetical protein